MLQFLKAPFLVLYFSYLYINDLPDDVICNVAICADDTTLYSKFDQASDLWQELELDMISKTLWIGAGSGLLISLLEKLYWFHLTCLITLVLLMWKWIGLCLRKNDLLRCLGWLSLPNWIGALTLSLLLKLPPRKLESWFVLWSFFLLRVPCISINRPYGRAWNTSVMSDQVLLVATWNC